MLPHMCSLRAEGVKRLAILNGVYSFPEHCIEGASGKERINRDCCFSQSFCALISDMLQLESSKRPFAADVAGLCEKMLGVEQGNAGKRTGMGRQQELDKDDLKNFKFPTQTFDRKEIDRALDRGYS